MRRHLTELTVANHNHSEPSHNQGRSIQDRRFGVKYITRMTVTDSLKGFGKGLGSASPEYGYAWYAGI